MRSNDRNVSVVVHFAAAIDINKSVATSAENLVTVTEKSIGQIENLFQRGQIINNKISCDYKICLNRRYEFFTRRHESEDISDRREEGYKKS